MSYFIIIRGPLGIGKSTVSKKLAEILNGTYISIDSILEENGLDKVENEESIPVKNFIASNDIIIPQTKQNILDDKPVIIDGNFYHREQIDHLIDSLPFEHYVFTLKAPLDICIKRDRERPKPYGKDAATAVYNMASRFDHGQIINTQNLDEKGVIDRILSFLPRK